jgi:hypothetical protein
MAGHDPEARESALGVTTASPALHHTLAATWGMTPDPSVPQGKLLSNDVPCLDKKDCFHTPRFNHVKIVSDIQARAVMSDLRRSSTLYMNTRHLNDPARFIEEPSMISFLPARSHRAFHVFPYATDCLSAEVMKELISAVALKRLFVYNKIRHTAALGKFTTMFGEITEVEKHSSAMKIKGRLR